MSKAINSSAMRQKNEKIILSLINRRPISRAEIAKETGLTKAAVTIIIDELIKNNIVKEKQAENTKSVGRTPVMLYINKDSLYMIGINITRLDITVGLADLGGSVIYEKTFAVVPPAEAFKKIKYIIDDMITSVGIKIGEICKIGLVTPGPVDINNGMILNPPNFNEWYNISIIEELKKITDTEICFQNVSNGTALAEKYFGAADNIKSFISVQIDEGIGSGIVINNTFFTGLCELGHISVKYDGIKCECGNSGCFEKYASIPAILKDTPYVRWEEAAEDDHVIKREAEYISSALISVNNIFGFDAAVLCGEISKSSDNLIDAVNKRISGKMLSGKSFKVLPGTVTSKTLVAASIAVGNFFGIV